MSPEEVTYAKPLLYTWPCLLKMSWTLSELNVILAGADDWPWIPACLKYCKWHNILKKKKIHHLTPVWPGLLCFLGRFQSFRCCLHASLESILPVTLKYLPHLTAWKTHFHFLLMKNYMVLKALILEMEGWEQQKVVRGPGRSLCLQNTSAPCRTALKLFSIHVWPKKSALSE